MKIDKTIDLPTGTIVFQGELNEEELDNVITMGLVFLYLRGDLEATTITHDGAFVSDIPEQMQ